MNTKKISLAELAKLTNCELVGSKEHTICSVNTLEEASHREASFLAN